jgi:hypothetical protein
MNLMTDIGTKAGGCREREREGSAHPHWLARSLSTSPHPQLLHSPSLHINVLTPQRRFTQRSERVKGVDLHPTEPW